MNERYVTRTLSRLHKRLAVFLHTWVGWLVFAVVAYVVGMYATTAIVFILGHLGLFASLDQTSYVLIVRLIMYGVLLAAMIYIPHLLKQRLSLRDSGLARLMEWKDIGLGIAGVVLYFLLAMSALAVLKLIPGIDVNQTQDLDVGQVYGFSRAIVFVVLVIITPIVEEILFRGMLYGGLRRRKLPVWATAIIVSLLFGVAHGQLNVGVDVFCLSMVASYARELTGSIWAGTVLHMIKNLIAFIVVFSMGGGS